MATYKADMRLALEYASSVWSPIASTTSINKLQVMQNAALRTATGCTQDTNIQHYAYRNTHFPYTSTYSSTPYNTENTTSITSPTNTQHTSTLHGSKHHYLQQRPLLNKHSHKPPHSHYNRHKTNMRHIDISIVSRHLAIKKTVHTLTPVYNLE